jgi:hypothetical protein
MTEWQTSRSTDKRHTHTTVPNSRGQEICTGCQQIITVPILSSEDPRLDGAGLMRSGHHDEDYGPVFTPVPLPELLIWLYYDGPDYGFVRAPVAPYVEQIAILHGHRNETDGELWFRLSNKS